MCVIGWITVIGSLCAAITYAVIQLWAFVVLYSFILIPAVIIVLLIAVICLIIALSRKSKKQKTTTPFYK
jgi:hypothetical protein